MSDLPIEIIDSEMVTAVGTTSASTCAAIRCGLNNFGETRFIDGRGGWIVGSEAVLETAFREEARLAEMLSIVISNLRQQSEYDLSDSPVLVCVAERERIGSSPELSQRLAAELSFRAYLPEGSRFISQGRVGGVVALREARELLYESGHSHVVVAGVDSYLSPLVLESLDARRRLLTDTNSDGFVPGEAASAIVVRRPQATPAPTLVVAGIGFGFEKASIESDEPLRADGLVQAIRGACQEAGCDISAMDFRIVDVSGEQYSFKEASLALTRMLRVRKEEFDLWHAADCVGETGAAIGPLTIGLALMASRNSYAKGRNILCHFGNDDGKRASAVLTFQPVEAIG